MRVRFLGGRQSCLGREVARFSEAFTIEVVLIMHFDARAVSGWQSVLPHGFDFAAIFARKFVIWVSVSLS